MDTEQDAILATPFGALGVRTRGAAVAAIALLAPGTRELAPRNALAAAACEQLRAWLEDANVKLDFPLAAAGTAFQERVWRSIASIPLGATRTYGEIAKAVASAPRAVGQACARNPLPVVVPCHRVLAAGGRLGGFAGARTGYLVEAKLWLLRHEAAIPPV
ncbi:MAG: methylated-DNA--[protein]-cysteine S-methyltransferase [Rhodocyclaceae bacterium]